MGKAYEVDSAIMVRILEAIPEIVMVIDREGVILYINRVEPGYDRGAVIGMHASAILTAESLAVFQAAHASVLATGGQEEYDAMVTTPTGTSYWYRTRMLPLRRDGEIVATLLQSTNISDLKAAQEQIDRLRQLVPICSWCDRIQDGEGEWESMESYIERQADTKVTHGVCPDCFQRQMDDLDHNSERGGTAA
jgi:PAS domain S-box-containing protein